MKSSKRAKSKSDVRGKSGAETTVDEQELRERIAQKAYELYEKRGRTHACDVEDWLEAERLVVEQLEHLRSTSKESPKRANRSKEPRSSEGR
jgi:hypothetical protein